MPLVPAHAKVLVTGANGFIASWILRYLLDAGYHIRAAVRSAEKGQMVVDWFPDKAGKVEFVVVEDITKDGAFDEAVKGVQGIVHTASPVYEVEDPKDIIGPAVQGTNTILTSAMVHGKDIKRIVNFSSTACIVYSTQGPIVFSEDDWNDRVIEYVEKMGKAADPYAKYAAAKTLAEKAAWKFYETNQEKLTWDLVVLNPPFVFGPQLPTWKFASPKDIAYSAGLLYKALIHNEFPPNKTSVTPANSWVDVRDVAKATLMAVGEVDKELSGERLIVSNDPGTFCYQDFLDAAHNLSPHPFSAERVAQIPRGTPGGGKEVVHPTSYDHTKRRRVLGFKTLTVEETTRDVLADYHARGW